MPSSLAPEDLEFLDRRRWLVRRWNLVGSGVLIGLACFVGWMFWAHPRLINPVHVFKELEADAIEPATMAIMAAMLPVVVSMLFIVVGVFIGFTFAMIANERRYQRIIDKDRDREA